MVHQGLVFETNIICNIHIPPNLHIVLMPPCIETILTPIIPYNKMQWKPQVMVESCQEYVQMWLALSTSRYKWILEQTW